MNVRISEQQREKKNGAPRGHTSACRYTDARTEVEKIPVDKRLHMKNSFPSHFDFLIGKIQHSKVALKTTTS